MARDPNLRTIFIDSVVAFLQKFGFEGLDFDWEYPGFFEGSDPENDKDNFSALIRELAERLHPMGYLLSSAVSPGYEKVRVTLRRLITYHNYYFGPRNQFEFEFFD